VAPAVLERALAVVREEQTRDDDYGWRAAYSGGMGGLTERDDLGWREAIEESYLAYRYNPLGNAIIEQSTNFVLGGGARVVASDARVQRVVDLFWQDPDNAMDERIYRLLTELSLFGEQFVRYYVEPVTGRVVIRQLDPAYVTEIETDAEDVERVLRYRYAPPSRSLTSSGLSGDGEWIPAGEVSHFALNKVSNALRGGGDLLPVLPWLRRYREWCEDRVRQNKYKGAFLWHWKVEGAGKADVERLRAEWAAAPPEPATVLFTNEKEDLKAVEPHIGAGDVRDDGRALRLLIAAGAGIPEHYLSEGGNANRATAAEMGLPAIKRFQRRQEYFRQVLLTICSRAVREAQKVGRLGPRVDTSLSVHFEELMPGGMDREGAAAKAFAEALALAEEKGWVEKKEARRMWWRWVGESETGTAAA
jgi:hypothetical protein